MIKYLLRAEYSWPLEHRILSVKSVNISKLHMIYKLVNFPLTL